MLRNALLAATAALLLVGSAAPTLADGDAVTLEGEVVDLSCYLTDGRKGRAHKTCAKRCADRGLPIGILTDDGKVFLLMEDHADEEPYEKARKLAGERAKVSGKQFTERGLPGVLLKTAEGL